MKMVLLKSSHLYLSNLRKPQKRPIPDWISSLRGVSKLRSSLRLNPLLQAVLPLEGIRRVEKLKMLSKELRKNQRLLISMNKNSKMQLILTKQSLDIDLP